MLKAYKKISEDDNSITYQHSTLLAWLSVIIIIACFVGIFLDHTLLIIHTSIISLVVLYLKHGLDRSTNQRIKTAIKQQSATKNGKPYSFKEPLLITIPKSFD